MPETSEERLLDPLIAAGKVIAKALQQIPEEPVSLPEKFPDLDEPAGTNISDQIREILTGEKLGKWNLQSTLSGDRTKRKWELFGNLGKQFTVQLDEGEQDTVQIQIREIEGNTRIQNRNFVKYYKVRQALNEGFKGGADRVVGSEEKKARSEEVRELFTAVKPMAMEILTRFPNLFSDTERKKLENVIGRSKTVEQ